MSPRVTEDTRLSLSWPLFDGSRSQCRHDPLSKPPHRGQDQHEGESSNRIGVTVKKKSGQEASTMFHLPFRSKSHSHGASSQVSRLSTVLEASYKRTALSLDLDWRLVQSEEARYSEDCASSPAAQLRGGSGQRQLGKFGWFKTVRTLEHKPSKGKDNHGSSVVTYKGREIGIPQTVPALYVLPPASRFVREPDSCTAFGSTKRSPLNDGDGVHANQLPTPSQRVYRITTGPESTPLPPSPALLATPSRLATTNPFACVYGNPYAVRKKLSSLQINHDLAGSLIGRPSALEGSQTGYDFSPKPTKRNPLRLPGEAPRAPDDLQEPGARRSAQKARADRKWDALPPLPPKAKDFSRWETEEAEIEPFDTEKILSSLRPERLSLYHIGTPGHPVNRSAGVGNSSAANTDRPTQATAFDTRALADKDAPKAPDSHSVRTRDWDIQSCDADDLGIDNRLQQQQQLAKRTAQRQLLQDQERQVNVRNDNDPFSGLPEEDAPTPEGFFYADMIEIVNDYHEQLQKLVRRAYEVGEMSGDYWMRKKWRHRTALDKKLRAAEAMSGYKILTNENDIKEAIKKPIGYAVYGSLLKIRDPETWQRIFEPALAHSHPGPVTTTSQHHTTVPENFFTWLACKMGRGLRLMLAVPDDPDLKTCSSGHAPAQLPDVLTYQSDVGVLGSNIPARTQDMCKPTVSALAPTIQSSLSRSFALTGGQPRPSTQTERTPKLSNDTTSVNNNTMLTSATLVSPLNNRHLRAPRNRGYDQGTFVTIVAPSVISTKSEKTMAGYGTGKLGKKQKARDDNTEITSWPEADC